MDQPYGRILAVGMATRIAHNVRLMHATVSVDISFAEMSTRVMRVCRRVYYIPTYAQRLTFIVKM